MSSCSFCVKASSWFSISAAVSTGDLLSVGGDGKRGDGGIIATRREGCQRLVGGQRKSRPHRAGKILYAATAAAYSTVPSDTRCPLGAGLGEVACGRRIDAREKPFFGEKPLKSDWKGCRAEKTNNSPAVVAPKIP